MFSQIGPTELIVVLAIVLLVFGPKRLPAAGKALGSSMRGFKESLTGDKDHDEIDEVKPVAPAPEAKQAEPAPAVADPAPEKVDQSESSDSV